MPWPRGGTRASGTSSAGSIRPMPPASTRSPKAYGASGPSGSTQRVAGGAVDVSRNLALVPVARARGARRLEHEDRATGRGRLVLDAPRHDEDVTALQRNGALLAAGLAQRDVEPAIQDEEELVGVGVHVPHVVTLRVGDLHVVVVDAGDDAGTVDL